MNETEITPFEIFQEAEKQADIDFLAGVTTDWDKSYNKWIKHYYDILILKEQVTFESRMKERIDKNHEFYQAEIKKRKAKL